MLSRAPRTSPTCSCNPRVLLALARRPQVRQGAGEDEGSGAEVEVGDLYRLTPIASELGESFAALTAALTAGGAAPARHRRGPQTI